MLETGTSGLMSGEGKPPVAIRSRSRALPRLYARQTSALFSACRCFASAHSNALKAPFASAKLRRKGTKPAAYFSHICSSATRNACSGAAAVIGPALGQVNDVSAFWSARFGLRRFLCLLLLEVTHEQLRKRDLHEASVSDRNHHFFMRLVRRA